MEKPVRSMPASPVNLPPIQRLDAESVGNQPHPLAARMMPAVQRRDAESVGNQPNLAARMMPVVQRRDAESVGNQPNLAARMMPVVQRRDAESVGNQPNPLAARMMPVVQRQPQPTVSIQRQPWIQRIEEQPEAKLEEEDESAPVQAKLENTTVQRQSEEGEDIQTLPSVQRAGRDGGVQTSSSIENTLASQKGSGSPLDEDVRSFMEPRFGNDFSSVRIHTGSDAVSMNKELHAQAFTHGSDIYFNEGKYNSGSNEGKGLLGDELTHVVQQGGVGEEVSRKVAESAQVEPVVEGEQEKGTKSVELTTAVVPGEKGTGEVAATDAKPQPHQPQEQAEASPSAKGKAKDTSELAEPEARQSVKLDGQEQSQADSKPEAEAETQSSDLETQSASADAGGQIKEKIANQDKGRDDGKVPEAEVAKADAAVQDKSSEEPAKDVAADNAEQPETSVDQEAAAEGINSQPVQMVAQTAEAETAVAETSTKMDAAQSGLEQLASGEMSFAPSNKAMLLTTEENIGAIEPENHLGTLGNGLVVFHAEDPEQAKADIAQADKSDQQTPAEGNGGSLVQQIPPSDATAIEENKRQQAQAALQQFMSDGKVSLSQVTALGQTIQPRIQASATQAQASIDNGIQQNRAAVINAIAQARAKAQSQAAEARNQVTAQHTTTQAAIKQSTQQAKNRIEAEYQTSIKSLTQLQTNMVKLVNDSFTKAQGDARAVGTQLGGEAIKTGNNRAQQYLAEPLPASSGWENFVNGEDYHKNRRQAKADAATQVGQSYNEELVKKANESADHLTEGKSNVLEGVQTKINQTHDQVDAKRTAALAELDKAESASLSAASDTLKGQLQAIQQSLSKTLGSLEQLKTQQISQVTQVGQQQKQAIDQTGHKAIAALQKGVSQATQSVQSKLQQMASEATKVESPNPDALNATLAGARKQINSVVVSAKTTIEKGISTSSQGIVGQGQQANQSINSVGQQTTELVMGVMEGFSTSITQVKNSARQAFTDLQSKHTKTVTEIADRSVGEIKKLVSDVDQAFKTVGQNLNKQLNQSVKDLEADLRKSLSDLDSKISQKAEEAANKVQPAWKGWVKIIIDVVIAIVVTAAIIALAASGVGLLGAIGLAALIGAAGGVTKQLLHDAVDGQLSSADVYLREAALGAISGLISLAGAGAGNAAAKVIGAKLLANGITNKIITVAAKEGAGVIIGTVFDTVGSGITDTVSRALSGKEFSWGTAFEAMKNSVGVNFLGNLGGAILAPYVGKLFTKLGLGGKLAGEVGQQVTKEGTEGAVKQGTKEVTEEATEQSTKQILDPKTGKPFGAPPEPGAALIDPKTGKPFGAPPEPGAALIDPKTGKPFGTPPEPGAALIDPKTGKPFGAPPEPGAALIDPKTGKPFGAPPEPGAALIDPKTGQPFRSSSNAEVKAPDVDTPTGLGEQAPGGAKYVDLDGVKQKTIRQYQEIAAMTDDVSKIAQNTGIPEKYIAEVKEHIFLKEHELEIANYLTRTIRREKGNFSPLEDIAESWMNAMNKPMHADEFIDELANFRRLIAHEYVEAGLMKDGLPYLNPKAWREHPDYGWGNYPMPGDKGYGAHNLSPNPNPRRQPFGHWEKDLGQSSEGLPFAEDLSNLDEVLEEIRKRIK
jgi:hypothetical protein